MTDTNTNQTADNAAAAEVVPAVKVKAETKMDKARAVFAAMPGSARKDVIAAFKADIGLSDAAAATYYQNIRKASGLVTSAAPAAAEPVAEAPAEEGTGIGEQAVDPDEAEVQAELQAELQAA